MPKGMKPELWDLMIESYGMGGYRTAGDMKVALLQAVREGEILAVEIPKERALYRHMVTLREFYSSDPVSLKDIPLEHSAYVLEVLLMKHEETGGRVDHFTRAEVDWIIRVHAAAPKFPPWLVYHYAFWYWSSEQAGKPTMHLDIALARGSGGSWSRRSAGMAAQAAIDNVTPTILITNAQGAGLMLRLDKLIIKNINAASRTLTIYKVPSGGSISGDDYKIIEGKVIDPEDHEDVREISGMILENGGSLRALASAASSLRFYLSYWAES